MTPYVAYYRVSTEKQGYAGLGMEAQRESVTRYINATGKLVEEFTEVLSGGRNDRPKLLEALALCRRKKATLIVAKLDRLSRNVAFIANLMEANVEFVIADMPNVTKLTLHILAAAAENEREIISSRTKAALAVVKRDLAINGSRISKTGKTYTQLGKPENIKYLLAADKKRKVPQAVKDIILAASAEGLTLQAIADRLNGSGIKTPQGKTWWPQSVKNQLKGN